MIKQNCFQVWLCAYIVVSFVSFQVKLFGVSAYCLHYSWMYLLYDQMIQKNTHLHSSNTQSSSITFSHSFKNVPRNVLFVTQHCMINTLSQLHVVSVKHKPHIYNFKMFIFVIDTSCGSNSIQKIFHETKPNHGKCPATTSKNYPDFYNS